MSQLLAFKKMSEDDIETYCQIFQKAPHCISDITPNTMQVWLNHTQQLRFCTVGPVAVFQYTDPCEAKSFTKTTIIGTDINIVQTVHDVLDFMENSQKLEPLLYNIPEDIAKSLMSDERLEVQVDEKSSDYLFDTLQQVSQSLLPGSKRGSLLRRFERKYKDLTFSVEQLPNHNISQELLKVYKEWQCLSATTRNDFLDIELSVMRRHVSLALPIAPYIMVLRSEGKPVAFGIYHMPQESKSIAILHHLKADYRYKEAGEYFFHQVMIHMLSLNVRIVNGEQDLGIEGMRRFKRHLGPCGFERRYLISRP